MSTPHRFTELMVTKEINALTRLHGMLEADGVRSREDFEDMMSAAFEMGGLEIKALANDLGFSFSTVFRWKEGASAPHPSLWPNITKWVMAGLAARSQKLEAEYAVELVPEPA